MQTGVFQKKLNSIILTSLLTSKGCVTKILNEACTTLKKWSENFDWVFIFRPGGHILTDSYLSEPFRGLSTAAAGLYLGPLLQGVTSDLNLSRCLKIPF